jgi:hypothetical protein
MRGGGYLVSFARSCRIKTGASKIMSKIKGGTSSKLRDKDAHIFVADKLACLGIIRTASALLVCAVRRIDAIVNIVYGICVRILVVG